MSDDDKGVLRPFLLGCLITVIGGVILAAIVKPFQKILDPGKRLNYSVSAPVTYLSMPSETNLNITVNQNTNTFPVTKLIGCKVKIWNSGSDPLKNLLVEVFFGTNRDLYCFSDVHKTMPVRQFGVIELKPGTLDSRRYEYELLNPGNEDEVSFVFNGYPEIEVSAKSEGLTVKRQKPDPVKSKGRGGFDWSMLALMIFICAASVLEVFLSLGVIKWRRKNR